MTSKKRFAFASFALCAAAGLACGQVTTGTFTPDATDDYESYPGGRTVISSVFGGDVPVAGGSVEHRSVNEGDWFDFRTGPLVQAQSGDKFGVEYGFGSIQYDFTGVGGASGFSGWACAAGVGDDVVEFFDMSGAAMSGTFTKVGGFGADGVMEQFSFVSTVPIGRIRFTGAETCFDDIAYASAGATVCPDCLADCDGSGTLDFFDFICFQNLFEAGDMCADCDASGTLDFFDFICFQNEFEAGCPVAAIETFGTEPPPSTLCGERMTPFPVDARPLFSDVSDVPSPLSGSLSFSSAMNVRQIGSGWASWSHGYTGSVYYSNGASSVDIKVPANSAFYLYVEPNAFQLCEFEIKSMTGGVEAILSNEEIHGSSGAKGYGFCGGVELVTVTITGNPGGFFDFAVGEFGIAD